MTTPKLPSAEELGKRMVGVCAENQALVGSPRPIPSPGWFAEEFRSYARAVLEAAAEVVDIRGCMCETDDHGRDEYCPLNIAYEIRKLKGEL